MRLGTTYLVRCSCLIAVITNITPDWRLKRTKLGRYCAYTLSELQLDRGSGSVHGPPGTLSFFLIKLYLPELGFVQFAAQHQFFLCEN